MPEESEELIPEADEGTSEPPSNVPKNLKEDDRYMFHLRRALDICTGYKPKFGQGGKGVSVEQFKALYEADVFYQWVGLDSELMYAAHKAAGGMTSVYRQLGIGAQWVLNQVIQDHLGLSKDEASWKYEVPSTRPGKMRWLALDARIEISHIKEVETRARIEKWMNNIMDYIALPDEQRKTIKGAVFEARQGYKSKDSKRQQGDIANASNAYVYSYIPVLLLFSNQLDEVLADRYAGSRWLILRGTLNGSELDSTYTFCRKVIGYDLAAFYQRNSQRIRTDMEKTLTALLSP